MSAAWSPDLQSLPRQALDLLEQYRRAHTELGVAWPTAVSDELQVVFSGSREIIQLREGLSVKLWLRRCAAQSHAAATRMGKSREGLLADVVAGESAGVRGTPGIP